MEPKKIRVFRELREAYQSTAFASVEVQQKENELKAANREEEAFWHAKSRIQWLNEGDKNTTFFSCTNDKAEEI